MGTRLQLHDVLKDIMTDLNLEPVVYFQPPDSTMMDYPCIRYNQDNLSSRFADNNPYKLVKRYQITVIDRNPDSDIPNRVAQLPMCVFDRFYPANSLNHFVYNIYF